MAREIKIDPVTRIEGHAKITLHLDDNEQVADARFHVTQFRGFEKFCVGRPFHEMPGITARICGICPVSHMLGSGKAGDELMSVRIPPAAVGLRKLLNYAQMVQSHALSFFHLSGPDLLLGMDAQPKERNVLGLAEKKPELARKGIRLRQFGQELIEHLAGKKIHASWVVPGGVNKPMNAETRDKFISELPEAMDIAGEALEIFKSIRDNFKKEINSFGQFPSAYMGMVKPDGSLEHYDGLLRLIDSSGNKIVDDFEPAEYESVIDEAIEPWSYLKFPYHKPGGYPNGMYRVGPLARLNVCDSCGTPEADRELKEFRSIQDGPVSSSFYYHYARLIEIVHGLERIRQLLEDPANLACRVRAKAAANELKGVGAIEAPRGTLIHHYGIDENGLITDVNLIVATGHNNLAMNKSVLQVAKEFVKGEDIRDGMLNRVEAVIRAYDPCLSCSTHALGQMPLRLDLYDSSGRSVASVSR